MLKETMGGRIEFVMNEQGLNNRDMANMLDISEVALSMYRYDTRLMPTKTVIKFCKAYGVDANWLLGVKEC